MITITLTTVFSLAMTYLNSIYWPEAVLPLSIIMGSFIIGQAILEARKR